MLRRAVVGHGGLPQRDGRAYHGASSGGDPEKTGLGKGVVRIWGGRGGEEGGGTRLSDITIFNFIVFFVFFGVLQQRVFLVLICAGLFVVLTSTD